ncbi:MAG: hypothetical protein KGL02_04615 [Acidobacteriota bacterium]|nr:hypothetical protein [Acidobacteriota bacterium]
MRGKDFNTGLRGVLFEACHYQRMGSAVWLYGWLVLRQTHQTGSIGWVLGGAPIRYAEIEEETGFNVRTLERWMRALRSQGYIETRSVPGGIVVRITKAKKHAREAGNFGGSRRIDAVRNAQAGVRRFAGGPRAFAERDTQNCVASGCESTENAQPSRRIGSSSLEESIEKSIAGEQVQLGIGLRNEHSSGNTAELRERKNNGYGQNPSCSGENQRQYERQDQGPNPRESFASFGRPPTTRPQPQQSWLARDEVRLQLELLRAEREEEVRRALRVGTGPQVGPRTNENAPPASTEKRP